MAKRKCRNCKEEFSAHISGQRYCSRDCGSFKRGNVPPVAGQTVLVFLDIDKYHAAVRRGPPK